MALVDEVRKQMMAAMKAKDSARKDALSGLLAALKDGVIKKRAELTPEEEVAIVSREIKQAKETLEYAPADREDIIGECKNKIAVLSEFMPEQMSEEEIRQAIEEVLARLEIAQPTMKDKGKIMKELMPSVKGKADGKQVNELLASYMKG